MPRRAASAPSAARLSGRASAPEGLCGLEIRIRRVRGVSAAATRSRVHVVPVLEPALERGDGRAEQARGGRHRVVERSLDEDLVSGLEQRRTGEEVGARAAIGRRDVLGSDAVPRGDGLDEGPVALRALAGDVDRVARSGQVVERAAVEIAAREVDRRPRPRLGPLHVGRRARVTATLSFLRAGRSTRSRRAARPRSGRRRWPSVSDSPARRRPARAADAAMKRIGRTG